MDQFRAIRARRISVSDHASLLVRRCDCFASSGDRIADVLGIDPHG